MIDDIKEQTPEEAKAEEDRFFVEATAPDSMSRIQQGGEFLKPAATETMYSDQDTTDQIIEETRQYFQACAAIAALEFNPGFKAIMNKIDEMRTLFHVDNENMVNEKGVLDPARMQANIYASAKFQDLKNWINLQVDDYKNRIKENQDAQ